MPVGQQGKIKATFGCPKNEWEKPERDEQTLTQQQVTNTPLKNDVYVYHAHCLFHAYA